VTPIALTVNARAVKAFVEPRTHLADFLRDGLNLTGTHLGCEHGVCGACTLLLDGMPARSCITYAVACDGARVTTIEGLDDDEITTELRAAFTREHALQCGYCTPGMLISARDLVLRLPSADERSVRIGLSGNLCRCTGYVGIVRAVRAVIEQRRKRGVPPVPGGDRTALGPVGSGNAASAPSSNPARISAGKAETRHEDNGAMVIPDFTPAKIFDDHFTVAYPPERVFDMFGDVVQVAACFPGASLTGTPTPQRVEGMIRVKLGPISANFRGAARIERDLETLSGRIVGVGSDQRSRSSTQGEIRYHLLPIEQGAATRVELSIGYNLRGMLAQIAREGLVRDLATRLTADFVRNLDGHLSGMLPDRSAAKAQNLNGVSLLLGVLRTRARKAFQRIIQRFLSRFLGRFWGR
jgi:carbon-monoxide dehydrogenase small subunit